MDRLLSLEEGVRRGDAEAVHRMRVATRRLRASRRIVPMMDPFVEPLRELAGVLGAVRDVDVLVAGVEGEQSEADRAAVASFVAAQRSEQSRHRAALDTALDGGALVPVRRLRQELLEATSLIEGRPAKHARRALRRLRRTARGLMAATSTQLHAVRIANKRYRYTLELVVPELAEQIELTTELQDVLGGLRDDEVAVAAMLEHVGGRPEGHTLARQIAARVARRNDAVVRFQELWRRVPRTRALTCRLEEVSRT